MIDFRNNSTKTTIISGYKPFYIQKANSGNPVDTRTEWGMVAKTNPYPAIPTPKEPYTNDWLDEDGHDEYNAVMFYDPIEFSVSFYVKAFAEGGTPATEVLRNWLGNFFEYVRSGEFRTYDTYTGIGYRKVRFNGYDEDSFRARGSWAAATINVRFKVNDPTERMYLRDVTYRTAMGTVVVSGDTILPLYGGYVRTAAATANKTVEGVTFTPAAGNKLSVYFSLVSTAASPTLRIGSNGTSYPITHVPAGNFSVGTYYLFKFTGSVWDCLGTL